MTTKENFSLPIWLSVGQLQQRLYFFISQKNIYPNYSDLVYLECPEQPIMYIFVSLCMGMGEGVYR